MRVDFAFEADEAVRVTLRGAGGGHNVVGEGGIADRPLEGLLGAHRETDYGSQVRDVEFFGEQAVDGFDVVSNRDDRNRGP